jgi:regulator of replication initiation timing
MSKPQTYYSALSAGMARDRLAAENERLRLERDQLRAALDAASDFLDEHEQQEIAQRVAGSFSEPEREHQ